MKKNKVIIKATSLALILMMGLSMTNVDLFAHGYIQSPPSRGYQGKLDSATMGWEQAYAKYGSAISEPQSIEAPKGFPLSGPSDGQLPSAGLENFAPLDVQKEDYWTTNELTTGPQNFTWFYTAPHSTTKWQYYITKDGWNPNSPLTRNDLELIGEVANYGSAANTNLTHTIDIPAAKSGYNVIYAVWEVADTAASFYNTVDVNIKNDSQVILPDAPTGLNITSTTSDSIDLSWDAQIAKEFIVYRDSIEVGRTSSTNFKDMGLNPDTDYTYTIKAVDQNNNLSLFSNQVKGKTLMIPGDNKPSKPKSVHSMKTTSNSVDLMWNMNQTQENGLSYNIYRDGKLIANTSSNMYKDKNLTSSTEYKYTVEAVKDGIKSDLSDAFFVTTLKESSIAPTQPKGLKTKNITKNSVDLSWNSVSNDVEYIIYRNGTPITRVSTTNYTDKNLNASTQYEYYVKAINKDQVESIASSKVKITTLENVVDPEPEFRVWELGGLYQAGEVVSHNGINYKTLSTHVNHGDPNWAPGIAFSIFSEIK